MTSCLTCLLANDQKSRLKVLSNGRFLPIALDWKKKRDRCSENKKVKVRAASFEDALLIVMLQWLILCLFGIGVGICKEDHKRKN